MNTLLKNIAFWTLIILAVLFFYKFLSANRPDQVEVSFSQFMADVEAGRVAKVTITGNEIGGEYTQTGPDGLQKRFTTYAPDYDDLVKDLRKSNIAIDARKPKDSSYVVTLLGWLPILLMLGVWIFFMRQMQSGGNKALSFGKSKAKLLASQQKKVTFKDVAGADEAKEELQEIIEFLREPQKFQKLGGRIPKGVLLM
ncbi:MAG: ATP-dependent metallopeptidase FtsH/Yme1/Tma family protein, partial [Acidobacteria bacterium]|nr:ATP-dependent metallopeptidase FtsH/Yme1/Tma family protein [Acidobacteriota bacterium]